MTDWDPLLRDLQQRRDTARAMGGTERLEQHRAGGRLDARARVERLLDPGTFVELGALVGSVHRGVVPPVPAELGGAYSSADTMSYDDVVEPRELRNALLAALRLASARRTEPPRPARHHGIRP